MKNSIHHFKLNSPAQPGFRQGFWQEEYPGYYLLFKVDTSINTSSLSDLIKALDAIDTKKTTAYRAHMLTKDKLDQPHRGLPCISNNAVSGLEHLIAVELPADFVLQYRSTQTRGLAKSLDFKELCGILVTLQSCVDYNLFSQPAPVLSCA